MFELGVGLGATGLGGAFLSIGNLVSVITDGIASIFGAKSGEEALFDKLKKFGAVKLDKGNITNNAQAIKEYSAAMIDGAKASVGTLAIDITNFMSAGINAIGSLLGFEGGIDALINGMKKLSEDHGIDKEKIKTFAEGLAEYTKAMALGAGAKGLQLIGEIANFAQQGVKAITEMIGGDDFLTSTTKGMVAMSSAEGINTVKIQQFANALVAYTGAMHEGAKGKSKELLGSMANLATTAVDGISKLLGGDGGLPALITSLKTLSKDHGIDKEKIKTFAEGVSVYATAMSSGAKGMKAGAGIALSNFATQAVNAIGSLLGFEGGIDALLINLKKLSGPETDGIDSTKIGKVAVAMQAYSKAMDAAATAGGATAWDAVNTLVTGVVKSIGGWLGITEGKSALDKLKDFAKFSLTPEELNQITVNASAIRVYAKAMKTMSELKLPLDFGDFLSSLLDGFKSWFAKDVDPMDDLTKFSKQGSGIDVAQIKNNVEAINEFAKLGAGMGGEAPDIAGFAESLKKSLPALHKAIQGYEEAGTKIKGLGDESLFKDYSQAGKNVKGLMSAFSNINIGKNTFMGSDNFEDFGLDLWQGQDEIQKAIMGDGTADDLGLASKKIPWAQAAENISMLINALSGTGRGAGPRMTGAELDRTIRDRGDEALGGDVITTTVAPNTTYNSQISTIPLEHRDGAGQFGRWR